MNIFDNIAKNVKKATVPAIESLTETEIDGLAMAATTSEDYDTLGAAMEAMGVETAYKKSKINTDELTDKEIQQLYEAGMEDEDPDDYEDPYAEEAIIDGYIEEAYEDEADEAIDGLTADDLEDIDDDLEDATESFTESEDDIAEEAARKSSPEEDKYLKKFLDENNFKKIKSNLSYEEAKAQYEETLRKAKEFQEQMAIARRERTIDERVKKAEENKKARKLEVEQKNAASISTKAKNAASSVATKLNSKIGSSMSKDEFKKKIAELDKKMEEAKKNGTVEDRITIAEEKRKLRRLAVESFSECP